MFGAVNALFTGLAFAILIFTVWLQRHELSLQRNKRLRKIFGPHIMYDASDDDSLTTACTTYLEFYDAHQEEIGHYFRHLYHIIKFVKTSDIDDKRRYTDFVRAQLSSFELALLFYNGLSAHGREKFKPLIEEFALFKNLPSKILLKRTHREFYEGGAYGDLNALG